MWLLLLVSYGISSAIKFLTIMFTWTQSVLHLNWVSETAFRPEPGPRDCLQTWTRSWGLLRPEPGPGLSELRLKFYSQYWTCLGFWFLEPLHILSLDIPHPQKVRVRMSHGQCDGQICDFGLLLCDNELWNKGHTGGVRWTRNCPEQNLEGGPHWHSSLLEHALPHWKINVSVFSSFTLMTASEPEL